MDKEIEEFSRIKKQEAMMLKNEKRRTEKLAEIEDIKAKTARLVERRDGMNQKEGSKSATR